MPPSPRFTPLLSPGLSFSQAHPPVQESTPSAGPLRHPRPMTAADLHTELEKEQEAVVNRLTRELSILRAQANASVSSNHSSTSNPSVHEPSPLSHEPHPLLSGTSGFTIPSSTGRMHHARTASNTSIRSTTASHIATAGSSTPAGPRTNPISVPLSRQSSQQSRPGRSRTSSPAPGNESFGTGLGGTYFPSSRFPASILTAQAQQHPASTDLSPSFMPGTRHIEEATFYRSELDTVKRENDSLRRRIKELERIVRDRRASDASRPRSESVSTTTSASVMGTTTGAGIAGPRDMPASTGAISANREREPRVSAEHNRSKDNDSRPKDVSSSASSRPDIMSMHEQGASSMSLASATSSVAVGVPEDEVKVGESAASRGVTETAPIRRSPAV